MLVKPKVKDLSFNKTDFLCLIETKNIAIHASDFLTFYKNCLRLVDILCMPFSPLYDSFPENLPRRGLVYHVSVRRDLRSTTQIYDEETAYETDGNK